jgi:hypothetical protein
VQRSTFARRGLLALAILAVFWAVVIALTGGFGIRVAGIHVSSRNIRNPLLLAFIAACGALALSGPASRRILHEDLRWWWANVTAAPSAVASLWWARWVNAAVVAACGGASLLLYQWVRARPLWLDEEMIALNIRDRPFLDLAGPLWLDQSAPLGWLATQRIAAVILGLDESGLRLVPVLFGVAAVAASVWVGRRWMTGTGAVALVLLLSLGQWVFHYSLELKHYSGDIFFGLMLPALVVWAIEATEPSHRLRRAGIWWVVAALGQWWAHGALFVTPACAVALWMVLWRIDGWRSAARFAVFGIGWLASFALNYLVALRFTIESDFLREYWSVALPPATAGIAATAQWLAGQAAPFADRPGGTDLALLFWATALCGFLFTRQRGFLYIFAAVPVSAYALAAMRLVPLYERLSLWAVPAMYVGIALCLDAGVRWARDGYRRARPARLAVAALMLSATVWVCLDIAGRGWRNMAEGRPLDTNHALDDRTAVRWLVAEAGPGDAVLTTTLGLPAVWWYGSIPISPPPSGASLPNGSPILEILYHPPGSACDADGLRQALGAHRRVLVYFGFAFDAVRPGFDELVVQELERIGHVIEFRRFAGTTRAAVVQVDPVGERPEAHDDGPHHSTHPNGCVSVRPAIRW